MTKPNMVNPQNFSVEALDRVSDFYEQSFEQLSQFYAESFSHLLTLVGWVGVIAGFVAPAIVWFINSKILEKDRSEMEKSIKAMRKDLEGSINKIKKEYEEKLEENLKKFREDFETEKKDLERAISIHFVVSQISLSDYCNDSALSIVELIMPLDVCLQQNLDESYILNIIKRIKNHLLKIEVVQRLEALKLEIVISDLKKYKKDNTLFQNMVSDFENAYNEALKRLK